MNGLSNCRPYIDVLSHCKVLCSRIELKKISFVKLSRRPFLVAPLLNKNKASSRTIINNSIWAIAYLCGSHNSHTRSRTGDFIIFVYFLSTKQFAANHSTITLSGTIYFHFCIKVGSKIIFRGKREHHFLVAWHGSQSLKIITVQMGFWI